MLKYRHGLLLFIYLVFLLNFLGFSSALFASEKPVISINIQGTPPEIQNNLINSLSLSALKTQADIQNKVHLELLYQRSTQQIQTVLKSMGYYKAVINSHLDFDAKKQTWTANYWITLGDPLRIHTIQFLINGEGQYDPVLTKLYRQSDLHPGKILNQNNYEKFKTNLLDQAVALGFFDAEISEHQIRINLSKNQADILFTLETGPRYHFGKTVFTQSGYAFEQKFLTRYLPYVIGQPYQMGLVNTLQSHLGNTEYFSNVAVTPTPDKKTHTVDMRVDTTTQKRVKYTLGLGYGTETGPRITLGSDIRYVNARGDYLTLAVQASKIYQEVIVSYVIPGKNPVTDYTSLNAGESYTNITPYSATTTLAGLDWGTVRGSWTRTVGIHENWIHYDTPVSTTDRAAYLLPTAELYYQKQIPGGFFTNGFNADITTTGTVKSFFSQSTFIKSVLTGRYAVGITSGTRVFFRGQAGAIGTHSITDLSPTLRFYTGGIGSVRGYTYSSLSPENDQDQLMGGRYLAVGSVNFEQRIYGKLSGLIFYDIGNSFDQIQSIDWAKGAGFGLSYQSPVGPIQFYFSHPVNVPDSRWRVDFSVGALI